MIIRKLRMVNFRGFRDKTIDFNDKSVVLLSAANGIGKTTTIDAIEWCLTGEIGRLKTAFNNRSTNESDRKQNTNGILKHRDSSNTSKVQVYLWIMDDENENILCREQKKDELNPDVSKVTLNGNENEANAFINQYVGRSFYNFHFCDIQKSLGIQNEKRSSLSEMFKEFVTDYSDEERVAENLKLFQRDAELKIEEKEKEKKNAESEKSSIEGKLNSFEKKIAFQEYPGIAMYEGESVDLQGKDQKFLREQQKVIYACGYSYVSNILKNLIENQKNEELCKNLDSLIQGLQENNDDILEAIKIGLYKETTCITELEDKIEEYSAITLNRNSILEKGPLLPWNHSVRKLLFLLHFWKRVPLQMQGALRKRQKQQPAARSPAFELPERPDR